MTKKFLLIAILCLAMGSASTLSAHDRKAPSTVQTEDDTDDLLKPIQPTYLKNVSEAANWGSNWYIEVKGGASAFLGKPVGCGDLFDRAKPSFQIGLGKWFTPAVGARLAVQGLKFRNAAFEDMRYQFFHADLLVNLTGLVRQDDLGLSRWGVAPFLGVGLARNQDWQPSCNCNGHTSGSHPFAFTYGINLRYRLARRLEIVAEVNNMTTFSNFDGTGNSSRLGDNILSASAGLSFTFGKVGYKRVPDASPYYVQNEWLREYAIRRDSSVNALTRQHEADIRNMSEYHKILEIEDLLDQYDIPSSKMVDADNRNHPKNNYSGLNSLRKRLNGEDKNPIPWARRKRMTLGEGSNNNENDDTKEGLYGFKNEKSPIDSLVNDLYDTDVVADAEADTLSYEEEARAYKLASKERKATLGAPIYFFFQLGTTELTDISQLVNIEEIARVANAYNLKVCVTGSADSATGTSIINESLSQKRADYIRQHLLRQGVPSERISCSYEGGVEMYLPVEANRNTCVTLSY